MEYALLITLAILGGALVGWTSASNMDKSALEKPQIFSKVDPLLFIAIGFLIPMGIGLKIIGPLGVVGAFVVAWLSSIIIGSKIKG